MTLVSLVSTVHAERGQVTTEALLRLLAWMRPEVLFLEAPPAALGQYFSDPNHYLEGRAVRRYSDGCDVELVPIDLPTPPASFFRDAEWLFRRLERFSADYCRAHDHHTRRVADGGFRYLNSEESIDNLGNIDAAAVAAIRYLGNRPDECRIYDSWVHTNELRDVAMIGGIADYCAHHTFARGAFLVGAAHRKSLIEKARALRDASSPHIAWEFDSFLEALN